MTRSPFRRLVFGTLRRLLYLWVRSETINQSSFTLDLDRSRPVFYVLQTPSITELAVVDAEMRPAIVVGEADIQRIMKMPGMIRSRRKIEAVIGNARCYQQIREQYGSFSQYIWSYTDGKTIIYNHHCEGWIPAGNGLSDQISKDLKRYGFKYLGSITVYSHLQACGIINDHAQECPRFQVINENYPVVIKRRSQEQGVRCFGDS